MTFKVRWQAGNLANGQTIHIDKTEALERYTLCFNQLYEGDNGQALRNGTAWVKLEQDGRILINSALEAARM